MTILQYLVIKDKDGFFPFDHRNPTDVQNYVNKQLFGRSFDGPVEVLGVPEWHLILEKPEPLDKPHKPKEYIYPIAVDDDKFSDFRAAVAKNHDRFEAGANIPMNAGDHWCPAEATSPMFGTRRGASQLIKLDALPSNARGQDVNVVIIDRGLDKRHIPNFGGGWWRSGLPTPGTTVPQIPKTPGTIIGGHGAMLLRSILQIAPEATVFDCPLLPLHISNIQIFLTDAIGAYQKMIEDIIRLRKKPRWSGPWVFVNAWAIYNRSGEYPPGDYTEHKHHKFNRVVSCAVANAIDIVFCAGNCGQFCPDSRCGPRDRGPGHSIFGANSHADVFTVAAVRSDGRWLGYSSQGPGQPDLDVDKPDVSAPSQFCETRDSLMQNTGTSAACAILAGVIAAFRSIWGPDVLTSKELKEVIRSSAKTLGRGDQWKQRYGSGILDVNAAYRQISQRLPGGAEF
jgi:subtilase family protein